MGLRLSFSLLQPELIDEGVRRLAAAMRAARRNSGSPVVTPVIS
jgi:hypothetical protein